jgi:hypothetical protein
MFSRFFTPYFLQANFSPEGAGGAASGGGADPGADAGNTAPPTSLADAAGVDPAAAPANENKDGDEGDQAPATPPAGDDKSGEGDKPPLDNQKAADKLYAPEGLPEEFRGETDRETIDKLLAARPEVPKEPGDYKYELSEATAKLVGNIEDDPVLAVWREVSHDLGMTNDQSNGGFDKFIGKLVDKKLIPAPVDFEAELKQLQPDNESDPQKAGAEATKRVQNAIDFVNGLKSRKIFSDDEANMLYGLSNSAKGVVMLEKLAALGKSHGVQGGGAPAEPQEKTQAEILYGEPAKRGK